MALESRVLSTDEFKAFSKKVVPYLSVMTHIEGRKDDDLLTVYGFRGFPSLAFLDAEGNKIKDQRERTVKGFQATADYLGLKAKVEAGDKSAAIPYFFAQMKLGDIDFKGAQKKVKTLKLSKEQMAHYTEALIPLLATLPLDAAKIELKGLKLSEKQYANAQRVLMSSEIMNHLKTFRQDRGAAAKAAFYKMWKEGRTPTDMSQRPTLIFWDLLLRKAGEDSDLELMAVAWGKMRPIYKKNPRAAQFVETQDAKLEKLKKNGADDDDGDNDHDDGDNDHDDGDHDDDDGDDDHDKDGDKHK